MQYQINKNKIIEITLKLSAILITIAVLSIVLNHLTTYFSQLNNYKVLSEKSFVILENYSLGILIYLGLFGIIKHFCKNNIIYTIGLSSLISFLFIYLNVAAHFDTYMLFPPESEDLNLKEIVSFMPYQPYLFLPLIITIITIFNIYLIKKNKSNLIFIIMFISYFSILNINNYLSERVAITYSYNTTMKDVDTFYKNGKTEQFCSVYGVYCFKQDNTYIFGNMKDYLVRDQIKKHISTNNKLNNIISINKNKIIFFEKNNTKIFITDFYFKELNINTIYSKIVNVLIGLIISLIGGFYAIRKHKNLH